MKNKILIIIILFAALLLFKHYFSNSTSIVIINGKTFNVDVARSDAQKEKGLAIYHSLLINRGMVFPFEKPGYYNFWMKDMKFPIDIIYINNDKIVDIFKNLPPPKSTYETPVIVKPDKTSDTVFEINAGLSQKYNFKIEDPVKIYYDNSWH